MPTDTFTDSIAENLHMQPTALRPRRQNSVQSVFVEENDQKPSSPLTNGDYNEPKSLCRRSKRNGYWCIALGIICTVVVVGWLITLTMMVNNLNMFLLKLGLVDKTQGNSEPKDNSPMEYIQNLVSGSDRKHGVINMELDVLSLFDNTTKTLKYKNEQDKTKDSFSGVKYDKGDGSLKIQKNGLFLIYSKVLVINFDNEKTVAFEQCVLLGNDNSECDLIKTLPKTRFPSHVLYVGHLQKDTVIKVQVNRKEFIFRETKYSKLKIIEFA